jgi:hypothetical protein
MLIQGAAVLELWDALNVGHMKMLESWSPEITTPSMPETPAAEDFVLIHRGEAVRVQPWRHQVFISSVNRHKIRGVVRATEKII